MRIADALIVGLAIIAICGCGPALEKHKKQTPPEQIAQEQQHPR